MKIKQHLGLLAFICTFVLASCGEFAVGIEAPPLATESGTPGQPLSEIPVTPLSLPPTPVPGNPAPNSDPGGSQFWAVYQDPGLGFRFAVPCFWRVEFLAKEAYDLENGTLNHAFNYTSDYSQSFPRNEIPVENGAVSVTFDVINIASVGLPPGSSLTAFVTQENSGGESQVLETVDEEINGHPAIAVTINYLEPSPHTGRYYLIKISDEFFLRFSVFPSPKLLNTPDVASILHSITVDPELAVDLPTHTPAAPPIGLAAPCIPDYATAIAPTVGIPAGNTACGLDSYKSLDSLVQAVQQALQDRNTGGLRWEYRIHDPFVIGYWGSEYVVRSPDEVATELANSLYAPVEPGGMTFTTDRGAFPPLAGMLPDDILGNREATVQVVYSEGWGQDKLGAALLYFAQDECGGFYWYGLVFSQTHFDK